MILKYLIFIIRYIRNGLYKIREKSVIFILASGYTLFEYGTHGIPGKEGNSRLVNTAFDLATSHGTSSPISVTHSVFGFFYFFQNILI